MLFNCEKCKKLTVDYVNSASGLELHQFKWLESEDEIGEIDEFGWNFLVDVQELPESKEKIDQLSLVHWTLGGPWFKNGKNLSVLDREWLLARDEAMNF